MLKLTFQIEIWKSNEAQEKTWLEQEKVFNQLVKQQQLQPLYWILWILVFKDLHQTMLLCVNLPSSVQIYQLIKTLQTYLCGSFA